MQQEVQEQNQALLIRFKVRNSREKSVNKPLRAVECVGFVITLVAGIVGRKMPCRTSLRTFAEVYCGDFALKKDSDRYFLIILVVFRSFSKKGSTFVFCPFSFWRLWEIQGRARLCGGREQYQINLGLCHTPTSREFTFRLSKPNPALFFNN